MDESVGVFGLHNLADSDRRRTSYDRKFVREKKTHIFLNFEFALMSGD